MIELLFIAYFVVGLIVCGICWYVLYKDNEDVPGDIFMIAFIWPVCVIMVTTVHVCRKINERRGESNDK